MVINVDISDSDDDDDEDDDFGGYNGYIGYQALAQDGGPAGLDTDSESEHEEVVNISFVRNYILHLQNSQIVLPFG